MQASCCRPVNTGGGLQTPAPVSNRWLNQHDAEDMQQRARISGGGQIPEGKHPALGSSCCTGHRPLNLHRLTCYASFVHRDGNCRPLTCLLACGPCRSSTNVANVETKPQGLPRHVSCSQIKTANAVFQRHVVGVKGGEKTLQAAGKT